MRLTGRLGNVFKNEQGSALLLVFVAVTVLGIMLGGVTLAVHNSQNQSLLHERNVQAEYRAEQSMELAVYMLYNQPDQFTATFRSDTGTHCMVNPSDPTVNVCLETSTDEQGQTVETLVASADGAGFGNSSPAKPESAIRFQLTASESPVTPEPTPDPTPIDPSPSPTPDPEPIKPLPDAGPYPGEEICGVSNTYLMRALVLGDSLQLGNAMLEDDRRLLKNDPYAYKADSVDISGGVYLDNNAPLVIARPKNNDKFDIYTLINGWIRPEGGLEWSQGNGHQSELQYSLMGPYAQPDSCSRNVDFHAYVNQLGNKVYNSLQAVPVYYFSGNVTSATKAVKKPPGSSTFLSSTQTLGDVLAEKADKIILVNGSLQLNPSTDSQGDLIVYNTASSSPSTLKLPDNFVWNHSGAITAERILNTDAKKPSWPSNYRLYVTLTAAQAALYDQDGR
ncbi:hypothetical protein [Tumebacillus flagellatus]|uniref:Type 4 fimbrial biogenesis protein PilX N-terminal domain-containing protein n=1 Tax=Tumebacillus flagellatus TaxID=1157490 RepID=A0A074LSD1_9BACL|nr:hypothetical protein [Tumebacillus flagellatus]KEO82693.1 hypothetical protein EL26_14095 [Tumebacillus flagellatus]